MEKEKWMSKNLENLAKIDEEKAIRLQDGLLARVRERKRDRELQDYLELNYRYFRFNVAVGDWIWGVSVSFGWKEIDGRITYSFALQSKNDHFSRSKARKLINKRFALGNRHSFVKSDFPFSEVMLVLHYNGMREYGGIEGRPLYLRKIPIFVGGCVDNFRKDLK